MTDQFEMPECDKTLRERLERVSTATASTILFKAGFRNLWIRDAIAQSPIERSVAGPAFTLRFVPAREDRENEKVWSLPVSTRAAIENMPAGYFGVVDTGGQRDAGVMGDILASRMVVRGVCGLVTDGPIRDAKSTIGTGLPIWCRGAASPPAAASMGFVGWNQPIGCGGVAVYPGDWVVADGDGAVIVPRGQTSRVIEEAKTQDRQEAWIIREVRTGSALTGLYPMSDETRARFEASSEDGA